MVTRVGSLRRWVTQASLVQFLSLADDGDSSASTTATGRVLRNKRSQLQEAGVTIGQAETVLDVMEQESKVR